ncbi:hypothetical protein EXW39_28075 (plasmid) [Bacillus mycoides]|uniref:hypothetical protein n=1 Tax=Bacillus mycoides TaxID=1405 RepID=UPI001C011DE0|nr:hypothetical protein [Bacillus mycoides]QWH63962.1 hypothetical protein EXW39_28075 [Bacillus mycoides]
MKKVLYSLMVFSMMLVSLLPNVSFAEKKQINTASFEDSLDAAKKALGTSQEVRKNKIELDDSIKNDLLAKTKELISSGEVKTQGVENLNVDNLIVTGLKLNGNVEYSVSYSSIKTDEKSVVNSIELFNVVFNDDLAMKNVYEIKSTRNKDNKGVAQFWVDEKLVNKSEMDLDAVVNSGLSEKQVERKVGSIVDKPVIQAASWSKRWSCTQSCVASKGVNLMVIGMLVGACGVACTAGVPATAGTACYACVNSAGILGANTVLNCLDECD